jgi:glycosyltransferase involved in cell wall biosynthesis
MTYRIFCVNGPGDTIKDWSEDQHDPRSITFKSQFNDFCRDVGAETYIVAYHEKKAIYRDGLFTLEHRPKPMPGAAGIRYYLAQALYTLSLVLTAVRFRADTAVLDSGTSQYFMLGLFKLAGIRIVIILHNTLWPTGFPPTRLVPRIIATLDSLFFRYAPLGIVGVSPECIRQVEQLTKGKHQPIYQIRAQFRREYFRAIPAPPPHNQPPFRIMFMGRITRDKGVFDILEMARRIEAQRRGRVRWEIHGVGPDLEELRRLHRELSLKETVFIYGWTSPQDAQDVYARSHVSIVPTRRDFCEGLPMTAIESVLAGRPVITSPVNPAFEVLRPACVEAQTDDIASYVQAIVKLIDDPDKYATLCKACSQLQDQFYDPEQGLRAALKKVLIIAKTTTHSPGRS